MKFNPNLNLKFKHPKYLFNQGGNIIDVWNNDQTTAIVYWVGKSFIYPFNSVATML